ncbi:hypothetical protein ACLB1O_18625 [Escherichia coli]
MTLEKRYPQMLFIREVLAQDPRPPS